MSSNEIDSPLVEDGDDQWDIAEPRADALIESLRSFGYSPETAIADLLDNSISAGARSVDVTFTWNGSDSSISVADDGRGMSAHALYSAMRLGSTSPLAARAESDLGRFGLGLKTASFSQARELTVQSRASDGELAVRRWDLDFVAANNRWQLLRTAPDQLDAGALPKSRGTVVTWTKCDRLVGAADVTDHKAQTRFNETARRVGHHLAATFHRFMVGRGKITIRLNGVQLEPWDPFLEVHPATQNLGSEVLPLAGRVVVVTPFVLPHRSKLNASEQDTGAGARGWNQQQGFYLYRGNRLLVQGDWLGLGFARDEHAKLARIRIDFPSALDHEWQVDVKKSSARAPGSLAPDLKRIASAARRQAEEVYRHRGKVMVRRTSQEFVLAWHQVKTRDGEIRYQINRKHPAILGLLEMTENVKVVERALRFIEETIPTTLIGVSIADALDQQPAPFSHSRPELGSLLELMLEGLLGDGMDRDEAVGRIAAAEPFINYPEVIQAFREKIA
ncbi:ATP-binding protein [Nocardioides sp. Root151]|uniref:ATP-binding protein n=1 Tax=Nocardioides sp. Root151 TaxID=1736475 RepID=UPI00070264B7|nr:ATP-binding protein [Nocardioides sp. Root151]KQZ67108.1 hypothetical protein ASD66_19140 [Nocardioides sp. Root151]